MNTVIDPQKLLADVRELPQLPKAVHEIALALQDENLCLETFARKISIDPAMVVKMLRAANSPFYGMSGRIRSVQDAIALIGLRAVGTLVMTSAVVQSIPKPSCAEFVFERFWEHSLATAICAQELARNCGESPPAAFTAGLIHDIGRLALATYYPRELSIAIEHARREECPLLLAESHLLGIGHAEVGAWIAMHWRFADDVAEAIRHHHDPVGTDYEAPASLADIVHAADGIVHALDLTHVAEDTVPLLQTAAWARLKIAPDTFLDIFESTERAYAPLRDALI